MEGEKSRWLKGVTETMASALFFGMVPLLVRTVNASGSNTFATAFYRFALSVLPLYLYLRLHHVPLGITRREFRQILLITVFGYGGTAILLFCSYLYIPSGMATTIHFLYPVGVILGSIIFLHKPVRPVKLLCAALCFGGMVLLYFGGSGGEGQVAGIALAALSSMTYAFYIIYLDHSTLREMSSLKLIMYMNLVSTVIMLGVTLATGTFCWQLPAKIWLLLLIFALGAAFIGAFLFQTGVKDIGPQNAAILSTFEPLTSLAVGFFAYDETFSLAGGLGCCLILLAVVIVAKMREE